MIKSELAARLMARYVLPARDAEKIVSAVLEAILASLVLGQRVELRGFGSFSVKQRSSRVGRNPRSGAPVSISEKRYPRFRASKVLQERLNGP